MELKMKAILTQVGVQKAMSKKEKMSLKMIAEEFDDIGWESWFRYLPKSLVWGLPDVAYFCVLDAC